MVRRGPSPHGQVRPGRLTQLPYFIFIGSNHILRGGPIMASKGEAAAKSGGDVQIVQVPPIKIVKTTVRIVGTSSLIVHAWSEKAKEQMRLKQMKGAKMAKEAKNPEADFKGAKYLDAKGRDCVPALAFKNAIVSAARFADEKMTILRGGVFVPGELLP